MEQIRTYADNHTSLRERFAAIQKALTAGVKWWAEHQSWPATDEIRIERRRTPCG